MSKRANGEGTIYKRKDGRWTARLSLPGAKRKDFFGKTRLEAARKLATATKTKQDGLPVVGERETVGRFLTRWLESVRPNLRFRTWQRYEELLRLHALPALASVPLARLSPQHLQLLYAKRLQAPLSPATVSRLHAVLHRALRDAVRWGLVARNVADLADSPRRERRETQTLSREQAQALLGAAIGDRLEALYVLALTTGMRQGELLALRWQDVDLERGAVQVRGSLQRVAEGLRIVEPKTASSRRQVVLTERAVAALRHHRLRQMEERLRVGSAWQDRDIVFTSEIGTPIEVRNLWRRSFVPLLTRAQLPRIRFHDLRHTAATLLLEQGVHAKLVAEMLGHSRIGTTLDLYSHVTPAMHQQAAAVMESLLRDGRA